MREYLYFQPEYVGKFKCDGTRCHNNCCARNWNVIIDEKTYEKYSRLKPADKAREITAHIKYSRDGEFYFIDGRPCPFLTESKLCGIQLAYGENFLAAICQSYPRQIYNFRKFFEQSMTLTCSLATEMILFAATQTGTVGKVDLLKLVDWYTLQTNHDGKIYEKISLQVRRTGDIFSLAETLLEQ